MVTDYLRKVLSDFHDAIQGIVATLTADHLLTVKYKTDRKILD